MVTILGPINSNAGTIGNLTWDESSNFIYNLETGAKYLKFSIADNTSLQGVNFLIKNHYPQFRVANEKEGTDFLNALIVGSDPFVKGQPQFYDDGVAVLKSSDLCALSCFDLLYSDIGGKRVYYQGEGDNVFNSIYIVGSLYGSGVLSSINDQGLQVYYDEEYAQVNGRSRLGSTLLIFDQTSSVPEPTQMQFFIICLLLLGIKRNWSSFQNSWKPPTQSPAPGCPDVSSTSHWDIGQ